MVPAASSHTRPLNAPNLRRQAAASSAAPSRVPLAAHIVQHRRNERLKATKANDKNCDSFIKEAKTITRIHLRHWICALKTKKKKEKKEAWGDKSKDVETVGGSQ